MPEALVRRFACLTVAVVWMLATWPAEAAPPTPAASPGTAADEAPVAAPPVEAAASPASNTQPSDLPLSAEQIAERYMKSVVVISHTGRDGRRRGIGSGFVVSPDGLIATNLHVIGEARPISVRLADGRRFQATSVHASDANLDLAVIRIDAKNLPALELGDSDKLAKGQAVVALGNPQGLEHSVVTGVVSGRRELDGKPMIQLAIPIEPGNSGGPLLDMYGRVHGLLTMKSVITANLGFAVEINALKSLLNKPNPVPMERWLTIGTLDPANWKPMLGARWRQRAGRILVDGLGDGFGGRSYCLATKPAPPRPYEVAVDVRLDDEAGAAGLIFAADGDTHYGFYPSGSKLRLTRFDGPDVLSWKILYEAPSDHYLPGEWNSLKVRVEEDRLLCYVNGELVVESRDNRLDGTGVGLTKFRDTSAEFRRFQVGKEVHVQRPSDELLARVTEKLPRIPARGPVDHMIEEFQPLDQHTAQALNDRARLLERQAEQLRKLAIDVHRRQVCTELTATLQGGDDSIDLAKAALLVARLDNPEVDVGAYLAELDRRAEEIRSRLANDADDAAKLAALNRYLFEENGFHGSRNDYYHRSNSYLNEVIDDREGLPITLSVLYLELARRLDLPVRGVGLPGHFIVKYVPEEGPAQLIDVFNGGKTITIEQAKSMVDEYTGLDWKDEYLNAVGKREIIVRILHNLLGLARDQQDAHQMLGYVEALVAVKPNAQHERWMRAVLRYQTQRLHSAAEDVAWLLERPLSGINEDQVRHLQRLIDEQLGR